MPLTYEEFRTKRDNILYRNEFTMTVVPVLTYLSAGMQAVADKLVAYPGEHPEQDLFREEVFEPALRDRSKWLALGKALGLPKEFASGFIHDMEVLTKIARMTVKKEAVEKDLFDELAKMHPEEALEDQAEAAAEKSLYASLHPEDPAINESELVYEWVRDRELERSLGDRQDQLKLLRRLDEDAQALKQECLAAAKEGKSPAGRDHLEKASRQMKAAMADLIFLNGKDEALYQELAGDLDEEWVKMDLQGSKKIREEQGIPEQYLWNPEAKDASAWPFPSKGAGAKPAEPVFREYRYHAFDGELPREKWTDEEVSEEELLLQV
jgi:hypothetical protein